MSYRGSLSGKGPPVDLSLARTYLPGVYGLIRCCVISLLACYCTKEHSIHLTTCIYMYLYIDRNTREESIFDINGLCTTIMTCHILNLHRPNQHKHVNVYLQLPSGLTPVISLIVCIFCIWRVVDVSGVNDIRSRVNQSYNIICLSFTVVVMCSIPYSESNLSFINLMIRYSLFYITSIIWSYSIGIPSMVGALYAESDKRDGIIGSCQTIVQNISLCQIRFIFMLLVDFQLMIVFAFIAVAITVGKSYSLKNDDTPLTHPHYCMQQNYVLSTTPSINLQAFFNNLQVGGVQSHQENSVEKGSPEFDIEARNEGGLPDDMDDIQAMFRKAKAKATSTSAPTSSSAETTSLNGS